MQPAPGSGENPNWNVNSPGAEVLGQILSDPVKLALTDWASWTGYKFDPKFDINVMSLTTDGATNLTNINTKATQLKEDIASLKKMSGGSDKISDSCAASYAIKPMKYDQSLEDKLPNLATFSDLLDNVTKSTEFATAYAASIKAPEETSGNVCGKQPGVLDGGGLIRFAFCGLAQNLESFAKSFMCFAETKLMESLGTEFAGVGPSSTSSSCSGSSASDIPSYAK